MKVSLQPLVGAGPEFVAMGTGKQATRRGARAMAALEPKPWELLVRHRGGSESGPAPHHNKGTVVRRLCPRTGVEKRMRRSPEQVAELKATIRQRFAADPAPKPCDVARELGISPAYLSILRASRR